MPGSKKETGQAPTGPATGAAWVGHQQTHPEEGADSGEEAAGDLAGARRPLSSIGPPLGLIREPRGSPLVRGWLGTAPRSLCLFKISFSFYFVGSRCLGVTTVFYLFDIKLCCVFIVSCVGRWENCH